MYDQNGKSTGNAIVHFQRVGDAAIAYQKFNTVPLDGKPLCLLVFIHLEFVSVDQYLPFSFAQTIGKPMKIEIILAPNAAQAVLPGQAPKSSHHSNNNSNNQSRPRQDRGNTRGRARGGRGARSGGSGGSRKETPKTAEQLDAEMNDYMQVDA